MDKQEKQFNEIFAPLRELKPSSLLLTRTLSKMANSTPATELGSRRFSYIEMWRWVAVPSVALALGLVFVFTPRASHESDIYAMELEAQEIVETVDYDSLVLDADYMFDELDFE